MDTALIVRATANRSVLEEIIPEIRILQSELHGRYRAVPLGDTGSPTAPDRIDAGAVDIDEIILGTKNSI